MRGGMPSGEILSENKPSTGMCPCIFDGCGERVFFPHFLRNKSIWLTYIVQGKATQCARSVTTTLVISYPWDKDGDFPLLP